MQKSLSPIIACEATQCAYNRNSQCHALAITVGDEEPCCDTFLAAHVKGGYQDVTGGVGACKVTDCVFNSSYECTAQGINVIMNVDHPDCGTFKQR